MQPPGKKDAKRLDLFREYLENILNRSKALDRFTGIIYWDAIERDSAT
jgi:hypothetical protein